ncbi:restriction endonuclease [Gilliamella sp. ESL0232]|uniref:restriction endonuclease n=1 Tax=unclassified Gilliamella TaxID=2685620 RepID=UPI00080E70B9|nr:MULTISPECIES: restriction endonuclease [Gilliamella]NUE95315.1 restriction endonuclease [Gilliamella sp. ESL0232]OCG17576.1 restriction endonuclease [Gilliamella apicola]
MSNDFIQNFLSKYDYDVKLSGNARWIDQKCTYDVVQIIADCILEYTQSSTSTSFTVKDIWDSKYAQENVQTIFSKPDPSQKSRNEYDKYFGQPIKLLAYSRILIETKVSTRYLYRINNLELLQHIALRPLNTLNFLTHYIEKVLKDSGLATSFNDFLKVQNKESYQQLKDTFTSFTIDNTPINGSIECGRIFTKIINPLAFKYKKRGTERGHISKNLITLQDLTYNRLNWRDQLSGKSKQISRQEHQSLEQQQSKNYHEYLVQKAKKDVRKFNDLYRNGKSEVYQLGEDILASQIHHIFTKSDFPEIADYLENLIAITPNQHFGMAHPENKTAYIDKNFQYICLIAKCSSIMENLTHSKGIKIYDFEDYRFVLNVGFKTDKFNYIPPLDFASIIKQIDFFCSDYLGGAYSALVESNYPVI